MPAEGVELLDRDEVLEFEDIVFAVQTANELGIERVRITGGEPLLRRSVDQLIAMLRSETDTREIAMTTNALLMKNYAEALAKAGLDRINVSIDSLRPDVFDQLTRRPLFEQTMRGVAHAEDAGFGPIKVNTVLIKGYNDDEVDAWVRMSIERDIAVRFLELMPIGEGAPLAAEGRYVNVSDVRGKLAEEYGLERVDVHGNGPARYWRVPGAKGVLGFITPISERYCNTCTRMRLTSTGELRPCLAWDVHVGVRDAIRGRDRDALREGFTRAAEIKPEGHHWNVGQVTRVGMSTLGG